MTRSNDSRRITAKQAIALLQTPVFCAEALAAYRPHFAPGDTKEDASRALTEHWTGVRSAFKEKYGVPLPPGNLLWRDRQIPEAQALLSGRWGLVRVFPWTTEKDVAREFQQIQKATRRAERETKNAERGARAHWLRECGYSDIEIATAIWGRRKGLKITAKKLRFEQEQALVRRLRKEYGDAMAERKAAAMMKAMKPHEAPAGAMVRQARMRYERAAKETQRGFRSPIEADPLSACIAEIILTRFPTYPIPFLPRIDLVADQLDPLLDELRKLLLTPRRA